MAVIARFYVQRMEKFAGNGGQRTFHLMPVTRGPENKTWAAATPSGGIQLTIGNPDAGDWFEQRMGKDVAITFEDRPLLCAKCKREVTDAGPYGQGLNTNTDGSVQHVTCPAG